MSVLGNLEEAIREAVIQAAQEARDQGEISFETLPEFVLEVPREKAHGDYAVNLAMQLAREAKMPPRKIAEILVARLEGKASGVQEVSVAGPGFINMKLDPSWLDRVIPEVLAQDEAYGRSGFGAGHRVQVEFVSANPTGLPHMGNARGAALGDAIASLLDAAGYQVSREYYINDAGNQIEKFGQSLEARYLQELGQDVEFPEDGYHGQDVTDTVRGYIEKEGDGLLAQEPEKRRLILAEYALEEKLSHIREALTRFGVRYDNWFRESTLYETGAVEHTLEVLRSRGYVYESEGATWLAATKFGEEKDEVMIRQNGTYTYFAADIAYHLNKIERGFETLINVWGADHHGHVARMKGAMGALGQDPDRLEVVIMQLVRLFSGGEMLRMSKRTGRFVTLDELMDEVGVDAARYFFVMRSADSHLDFDMDLARSKTSDNPVFYVQYAHARVCSILRQSGVPDYGDGDVSLLTEPAERELTDRIARLPGTIVLAAQAREPHRMCAYAHELAGLFHSFYASCRVLGVEPELMKARLKLVDATRITLRNVLTLIGVSAPEKM